MCFVIVLNLTDSGFGLEKELHAQKSPSSSLSLPPLSVALIQDNTS